jgi:hypothetical protein
VAYEVGEGGGNFADEIRRANEESARAAQEDLQRKEQQRRAAEETTTAETRVTRTRTAVAGATGELTAALERNAATFIEETAAIAANTAALTRNLELRRQLTATPFGGGTVAVSQGAVVRERVPSTEVVADPLGAEARRAEAVRALSAAEEAREAARLAVTQARRGGTTGAELVPLVERREVASQQVQVARAELRAAERNKELHDQLAAEQARTLEAQRAETAALQAQARATIERQAAAAAEASAAATATARQQAVGPGLADVRRALYAGGFGDTGVVHGPEPAPRIVPESLAPPPAEFTGQQARIEAQARSLGLLAQAQRDARQEFEAAGAAYADASTRLSRHGALTTEFISAFARGQVTLQEFGQQVTATIGKFGGWALAGALVYGVYDALRKVREGATETQAAVLNLGRFLPGVGGPAGGGTGQRAQLESTLQGLSTQFNVPISEAANAMQLVARTFHNINDAGNAAAAVLAAYRLDQVGLNEGARYLTGIYNAAGQTRAALPTGVFDSLNALQNRFSARVAETLPGVARAAPTFLTQGGTLPELEALVGLGVRGGLSGNTVGTALLRGPTFAFRGASQELFAHYGITATPGDFGGLFRDVLGEVAQRARSGTLTGEDLRALAGALGGNQLGARNILPILTQVALNPRGDYTDPQGNRNLGLFGQLVQTATTPPSYQKDLEAVTSSLTERFKAIGIALENFGSNLASAGALQPFILLAHAASGAITALEAIVRPFAALAGVLDGLPTVVKDVVGGFVLLAAAQRLSNTQFGVNTLRFLGRLPGTRDLVGEARGAVFDTRARLQRELIPVERRRVEDTALQQQAAGRARLDAFAAEQRVRQSPAALAPIASPEFEAYEERLAAAVQASTVAQQRYLAATERATNAKLALAEREADLAILSDRNLSYAQREVYLSERGYVAQSENVNLLQEIEAARRRELAAVLGGARASFASAAEVAAGVGGVAAAGGFAQAVAAQSAASRAAAGEIRTAGGVVLPAGVVPPAAVAAEEAIPAALFARATLLQRAQRSVEQEGVVGALGGAATAGLGAARSVATGGLEFARSALTNPFGLFLASQLALGALPSGAATNQLNQSLSTIGGLGLLTSFTRLGVGPGLAIGAGLDLVHSFTSGNTGAGIGGAAGAGIGAGIGAAVGTLTDVVTGPLGTMIGGAVGEAIGSVVGNLVGGGPSTPADQQSAAQRAAQRAVRQATAGNNAGLPDFARDLQKQLETAAYGSGSAASSAQANVGAIINRANALVTLFGADSPQGRAGRDVLGEAITSAVGSAAGGNPVEALQVLQTATQTRQKAIDDQFKFSVAENQGDAGGLQAATEANRKYETLYDDTWGRAAEQARETLAAAREGYRQAVLKGNDDQKREAKAFFDQSREAYQGISSAARLAHASVTLTEQQNAAQALASDQQRIAAESGLAVAQAGGNRPEALHAQLAFAQQNLQRILQDPNLAPRQRYEETLKAQAAIENIQTQQATQGLAELQGRGAVEVARTPLGDPVGQARANLDVMTRSYRYMLQHRQAFDPSQISQALAQMIDAQKQVVQATQDYADQTIQVQEQIQELQDYGNAAAQAQDRLAAGYQQLAAARTPLARQQAQASIQQGIVAGYEAHQQQIQDLTAISVAQAQGFPVQAAEAAVSGAREALGAAVGIDNQRRALANLINAQHQLQQAQFSQISLYARLRETQEQGDPIAVARAALGAAQAESRAAVTQEQQVQAATDLAAAQHQLQQAHFELIGAYGRVREAQEQGNPVAVARESLRVAQREQQAARTTDQQIQAATDLANAHQQLAQALQQQDLAYGALAASTTREPLAQLAANINAAAHALSHARGPANVIEAQTRLNDLKNQYEGTYISQTQATIEFQLAMQQITAQQALEQIQNLEKARGITTQELQGLQEEARRIALGDYSVIGGQGQFNFAPGEAELALPTLYDIRHRAEQGRLFGINQGRPGLPPNYVTGGPPQGTLSPDAVTPGQMLITGATTLQTGASVLHEAASALLAATRAGAQAAAHAAHVTNYHFHGADADAIDRATHSSLRARLRTVGLRGT